MTDEQEDRAPTPEEAWARAVLEAVRGLRFGSVEIVVHEGRVVQVETRAKVHFDEAGRRPTCGGGRKAQAWAAGINWYLNRYLKQVVNFERTTFTGGAATGNRAPENLIVFRTQIAY